MSVKSAVSALVISNLGKLLEGLGDRDRFWYENVGYSAPTTGLIRIARDLRRIGIDVENVVRIALSLHRFSYNGFDPNFVNYSEPREVEGDVLEVVEWLLGLDRYFRFDERLEREREEVKKLLSEFKVV